MIAAVLLATALWLGWIARRRPAILPWAAATCLLGYLILIYTPVGSLGDIQIHVLDLLVAIGLPVCLQAVLDRRWNGPGAWAGILVALGLIAFLRGLPEYGFATAGNALRQLAWFAVPAMAMLVAPPPNAAALLRPLSVLATGILLLSGLRYAGVLPMDEKVMLEGGLSPGGWLRPVPATAALALLATGAVLLTRPPPLPRSRLLLAGACLTAAVLLQHRSVWIAGLVLAALLVWRTLANHGLHRPALGWSCVLVLAGCLVMGWPSALSDALQASVAEASGTSGTGGWRVQSNLALFGLLAERPVIDLLVGLPGGHPLDRMVGESFVTVSTHNVYLQLLANTGLVGLTALAGLLLTVWRQAIRRPGICGDAAPAVVAALATYGLAYGFIATEALLLAGCAAAPEREETA